MGQSPMETTDEFEGGDSDASIDSPRECQSDAGDQAGETANPALGREWTDFAGANEYERDLPAPEWATQAESVIGREWQEFPGTNEYESDETPPDVSSSPGTSPRDDSHISLQSGD